MSGWQGAKLVRSIDQVLLNRFLSIVTGQELVEIILKGPTILERSLGRDSFSERKEWCELFKGVIDEIELPLRHWREVN